MLLLHTSDWHIGRRFHQVDLLDAQAAYLAHLAEVVRDRDVAAVLVSGDVYDRALPPVDAVMVLDEGLDGLLEAGAQVVVTAGNHDSATRLGFGRRRGEAAGLHVRVGPEEATRPVLLRDGADEVAVYGVGYLDPVLHHAQLGVSRSHTAVLGAVCDQILRHHASENAGAALVMMAHAFVTGGTASDSERDISVGGVEQVPTTVFDGADYVALGHLHGPAKLTDHIRYSGSPLPYSFSERTHRKGSWLVEVTGNAVTGTEWVPAPGHRELRQLRGTLAELLADPELADAEDCFCEVVLTDRVRPSGAMAQAQERFPHAVVLRHDPPERDGTDQQQTYAAKVRGADDATICARFLAHVRGGVDPTPAEVHALAAAWDALRANQAEVTR